MAKQNTLSRRSFIQGATASTLVFTLAAHAAAEEKPAGEAEKPSGPPTACAVIGAGAQGRALLNALSRIPAASVAALCDNYPAALAGGQKSAPKAAAFEEYRKVLDSPEISAVFVATPSHLHRQIVLDSLQAGKHVYCEAPLASSIEDAAAIARAAKAAKSILQVGQQLRTNPLYRHSLKFISSGMAGQIAQVRAQWHRKESWRRAAATPERERVLNWRLYKESSAGLLGEIGVHPLDVVTWALRKLPESVQGFGGILQWREDDREVADTVQCVVEYPGGIRLFYDATLANSFEGAYQLFMGSDAAIYLREDRGWMVKEADAPQIVWEVYAHKDKIGDELGIALIADATKHLAQGKMPGEMGPGGEKGKDALYYCVEGFLNCIREGKPPACGPVEGYQAAVTAIKANEAITLGQKVTFQKEWFEV